MEQTRHSSAFHEVNQAEEMKAQNNQKSMIFEEDNREEFNVS